MKYKSIVFLKVFSALTFVSLLFILFPRDIIANEDLEIDFGGHHGNPLFMLEDMKPGDVEVREIELKNKSYIDRYLTVRCEEIEEYKDFSGILEIIISVDSNDIYGGDTGHKTVDEFCQEASDEDGIPLSIVGAEEMEIFTFTVLFPSEAGNEYQKAKYVFNLIFDFLHGESLVINEVYYHSEEIGCGCSCCCGDFKSEECRESSCPDNIYEYNVGNSCYSLHSNGGENWESPCNMLETNEKNEGFSCSSYKMFGRYWFNHFSCDGWTGTNDSEWIEIFNPTERTIRLWGWSIRDNSGEIVRLWTWRRLEPGQFALITKGSGTWGNWNEGEDAVKIYLRRKIGNGLDDSGDHIHLISPSREIVDSVGWGNDTDVWIPAVPGVPDGSSIERLTPGFDTDSVSDWEERLPSNPGF